MSDRKISTTEEALAQLEASYESSGLSKEGQLLKDSLAKGKSEVELEEEFQQSDNNEQEQQLTDFEKEQQALGWRPDGEKTAKEWASAYPVYKALSERNEQVKHLRRTVDELKAFMDQQKEVAYRQALEQIEQERANAIRQGDFEGVNNAERQRAELKPVNVNNLPAPVAEFQQKHLQWLTGTDFQEMEMAEFAKKRDNELMTRGLPVEQHMELLEKHVMAKFPSYFNKNTTDDIPDTQAVEGNTGLGIARGSKKKYTFHDLNQEQKMVAKDFERQKVMTVDKYIAALVSAGELK